MHYGVLDIKKVIIKEQFGELKVRINKFGFQNFMKMEIGTTPLVMI